MQQMQHEMDSLTICNQTANEKYFKALKEKEEAERNAKNFLKQKLEIQHREEAILASIKKENEAKVSKLIVRIDEI